MPLMFSDVFFLSCTRPPLQGFGGVFFSAGELFMYVAELVFWWVLCFVFVCPAGRRRALVVSVLLVHPKTFLVSMLRYMVSWWSLQ